MQVIKKTNFSFIAVTDRTYSALESSRKHKAGSLASSDTLPIHIGIFLIFIRRVGYGCIQECILPYTIGEKK